METGFMNRIIGLVLALVVGGLLVGGLLIPSIEGMTATEKTLTNTGQGQYRYITSDESYTLEWHYSTPDKVIINGTTIDAVEGNETMAMGEFTLRVGKSPTTGYAQLVIANNQQGVTANVSDSRDFSFTYENGTITCSNGTTTKTYESTGFYAMVPEKGTHTMKQPGTTAYIAADDTLLVMGLTGVGSQWNTGYLVDGTIENYTVEQWTGTVEYPASNISDDSEKLTEYTNVYSIKQFTWDIDNAGTTIKATYSYFLVPISVTAELSQHMDATQIAMFGVISILGIVALVVVAANGIRNKY